MDHKGNAAHIVQFDVIARESTRLGLIMRKIPIVLGGILFAVAGYTTLVIAAMTQKPFEHLLVCADAGGLNYPFSKNLCRFYLHNFRGSPEDIAILEKGIGASFVAQGSSPLSEREAILHDLIAKGLDINNLGMHHMTALHEAVLANAVDEVDLLLRNGANPNLKDEKFGLTSLELAEKLQRERTGGVDRGAIIRLLRG